MPHLHRKPRTCEVCHETYQPSYYEQRTCGRACGAALKRVGKLAAPPPSSAVVWADCARCGAPFTTRGGRRCEYAAPRCRVFVTQCQTCTRWFCSPYTVSTCSAECSDAKRQDDKRTHKDRRRALLRDAFVEKVYRRKVYERDRWTCRLCGRPVKRTALVPDPMAPTLDHIVPLARGGKHEASNCQTAHYLCGEQLLLIG